MLAVELSRLEEARRLGLVAAVRLNGCRDLRGNGFTGTVGGEIPEHSLLRLHEGPGEDGTVPQRPSVAEDCHLTFSAQPNNHEEARNFLEPGGTVAVVFWPEDSAIALGEAGHRRRRARRQILTGRQHRRTYGQRESEERQSIRRQDSGGASRKSRKSRGEELGKPRWPWPRKRCRPTGKRANCL